MATEGKGIRAAFAAMLLSTLTMGQTAFPDHVVQNADWSSGTHHIAVTQKIIAPGVSYAPVSISGTADAEFKSGTQVRLTAGFHAGGFSGNGRFHAWIDTGLGGEGDVVVIAPDPDTSVTDNILHVNKWEKLDIGMILPLAYQDAVDSFFVHYYSNGTDQYATPSNVDPTHDLNPYADDSLQVVMTLTKPDGSQTLKWGFYMKEAIWTDSTDAAKLATGSISALYPYHIHFRTAPDEEGVWEFSLSIKAPHTTSMSNGLLNDILYTGYDFICDPPLEDNHGHLQVNTTNRRTLQFEDGTSFFGLGTNMADWRRNTAGYGPVYRQRDFNVMLRTMAELHGVGGNFMRMFLMEKIFTPEYVNLGVYDSYTCAPACSNGSGTDFQGNCQYQCWAFDHMLEQARDQDIHIQLCIDPYPPITAYEGLGWGANAYWLQFVKPAPTATPNPYDLKRFFFADGDPENADMVGSVFYYWKRKYKYIMSRWGYSVNIAAIEPFNEVDQMLSYQDVTVTGECPEVNGHWVADTGLPGVLNDWLTDIMAYVRDPVDPAHPASSPLGESKKLFLMSYTDRYQAGTEPTGFFQPFNNPELDLIDVHHGLDWDHAQCNSLTFGLDKGYRDTYTSTVNGVTYKKPFHNGEFWTSGPIDFDGNPQNEAEFGTSPYFDNYDVSFHNEIWASTFFGNFAAGTSWAWDRIFWWPEALLTPPHDAGNPFPVNPFQQFSNVLGATNILDVDGDSIAVINRTVYHNFKPLSDLLTNSDFQSYDFFNGDFEAHKVFEEDHRIECYYLMNADHNLAIGWIHNMDAYWEKHYYADHSHQNFLGCTAPYVDWQWISGFMPGVDYHVTWFPTRMNDTIHPADYVDTTDNGFIFLDLSTAPLGDTSNSSLDTLHTDYAFVISMSPVHRSMTYATETETTFDPGWGFGLYPNPADDVLNVVLTDDAPKDIAIYDLSGRRIRSWESMNGPLLALPVGELARGAYTVRVDDGSHSKVKQLIIR